MSVLGRVVTLPLPLPLPLAMFARKYVLGVPISAVWGS